MKVAAIDIGTNSVLLLIAETTGSGLSPLVERATITRLGEGVDRTRALGKPAVERTLACLSKYAQELARHAPDGLAIVGTSAMRDAQGGPELASEAERVLGVRPLVISGRREAELTFRGALSGLGLLGRVAVFDVGGGSTEIVVGNVPDSESRPSIDGATSLDIGSVRLFERHVSNDPPLASELDAIGAAVDEALHAAPAIPADATLVGVAGTVTTIAAIADAVDPYDPTRIHGVRLGARTVHEVGARLSSVPLAERRKLPGLDPRRADVIVTGAVLVERILAWSRKPELVVSDRGVRWGLVEELATIS